VDLKSGRLSGYIYSANCGWIGLSNAFAWVQTDTIASGKDSNMNGLPDAWQLLNFGHLGVDPNADPDGDGMSNLQEYLAGTNPNDANSDLEITSFTSSSGGTTVNLTWETVLTRCYYIQKTLDLASPIWVDSGLGLIAPDGASTTRTFADSFAPTRFYRVKAVRPLAP
jgi:hypothetical protein